MDTMRGWLLATVLAIAGTSGADEGLDAGEAEEPELKVLHRVPPVYPRGAYAAEYAEVACKVRVVLDTGGAPKTIEFVECPALFHESARTALMQWRWEPALQAGVPVEATFPRRAPPCAAGASDPARGRREGGLHLRGDVHRDAIGRERVDTTNTPRPRFNRIRARNTSRTS